jgi:hypothetical protein
MTIGDLTSMLVREMGLKGEHRLRNLTSNRLYTKEEVDTKLSKFELFQEGGTRL